MSRITPALIEWYTKRHFQLVPLKKYVGTPQSLKACDGKRPLDSGWTTGTYSPPELLDYVQRGHNLGCRLREHDLVLDIDPRNGGAESFEVLCLAYPELQDILELAPVVITGGGG